jgi:hypothetical protein
LTYLQQNADRSRSIYDGLNIVDDRANQNIDPCHEFPSQNRSDLGRFLPNESYSMMPSQIGGVDLEYLKKLIRDVRPVGISPPIPKERIPCVGGLVFVPIRELDYPQAMREIKAYIERVGNRRVYISELAEELQIDMDLIERILNDIRRSSGIGSYV